MAKSKLYQQALKELSKKVNKYDGYEDYKKRTITDENVREYLIEKLGEILDRIKATQESAIMAQMLMLFSDLENLNRAFTQAFSSIENTDYEQSTFFQAKKVEGLDVGILTLADKQIITIIENLRPKIETFTESIESGMYQDASTIVMDVLMDGATISKTWGERIRLIRNYKRIVVD